MHLSVGKRMIGLIRADKKETFARLVSDDPDFAYDDWLSNHEHFYNELCLMLLVAMRHQVERELIQLAARVTAGGQPIDNSEYQAKVSEEREINQRNCFKPVIEKLQLESFPEWGRSIETLRLLANCYKHSPSDEPEEQLLKHLALDKSATYAPLAESNSLREALAASVNLSNDADYCDIAEKLLDLSKQFLVQVETHNSLSKVVGPWFSIGYESIPR